MCTKGHGSRRDLVKYKHLIGHGKLNTIRHEVKKNMQTAITWARKQRKKILSEVDKPRTTQELTVMSRGKKIGYLVTDRQVMSTVDTVNDL